MFFSSSQIVDILLPKTISWVIYYYLTALDAGVYWGCFYSLLFINSRGSDDGFGAVSNHRGLIWFWQLKKRSRVWLIFSAYSYGKTTLEKQKKIFLSNCPWSKPKTNCGLNLWCRTQPANQLALDLAMSPGSNDTQKAMCEFWSGFPLLRIEA